MGEAQVTDLSQLPSSTLHPLLVIWGKGNPLAQPDTSALSTRQSPDNNTADAFPVWAWSRNWCAQECSWSRGMIPTMRPCSCSMLLFRSIEKSCLRACDRGKSNAFTKIYTQCCNCLLIILGQGCVQGCGWKGQGMVPRFHPFRCWMVFRRCLSVPFSCTLSVLQSWGDRTVLFKRFQ